MCVRATNHCPIPRGAQVDPRKLLITMPTLHSVDRWNGCSIVAPDEINDIYKAIIDNDIAQFRFMALSNRERRGQCNSMVGALKQWRLN